MNYVESFQVAETMQIPCLKGTAMPGSNTEGAVGCLYMETGTGAVYKCVAAHDGQYEWVPLCGDSTKYYGGLADAVADINEGTNDRAVSAAGAKVKVFQAPNGTVTAMLLDNVSEAARIDINKDLDIVLDGNTLSLTTPEAYLNFAEDTSCTIHSEAMGSAIVKSGMETDVACSILDVNGNVTVKGGTYILDGSFGNLARVFCVREKGLFEITDADFSMKNIKQGGYAIAVQNQGENTMVRNCTATINANATVFGMYQVSGKLTLDKVAYSVVTENADQEKVQEQIRAEIQGDTQIAGPSEFVPVYAAFVNAPLVIRNSQIGMTTGRMDATCIYFHSEEGSAEIENSEVVASSLIGNVSGVSNIGAATLFNVVLRARSDVGVVHGVYNFGNMEIVHSDILADGSAANTGDGAQGLSYGVRNTGTLNIEESDIYGSYSAVINSIGGILYVKGGTYTGYSHGGFYFAHGPEGEAYVCDALIRCGNYPANGVYNIPLTTYNRWIRVREWAENEGKNPDVYTIESVGAPLGGFYIRGVNDENDSSVRVYLDGCTFGYAGETIVVNETTGETYSYIPKYAFTLRGSLGEKNCAAHVSNCSIIEGSDKIRIDTEWAGDASGHRVYLGVGNSFTSADTQAPNSCQETGLLYRRLPEGAKLDSRDFNALVAYLNTK